MQATTLKPDSYAEGRADGRPETSSERAVAGAAHQAFWLLRVGVNLLTKNAPQYYDIALRDFGLMLAALTLGRLSLAVVPARKAGALPARPFGGPRDGDRNPLRARQTAR